MPPTAIKRTDRTGEVAAGVVAEGAAEVFVNGAEGVEGVAIFIRGLAANTAKGEK